MADKERQIFGGGKLPPCIRGLAIPWATNLFIWWTTVSTVVVSRAIENPKLLVGPWPKSETDAIASLADWRTALGPVAAAVVLGLAVWIRSRRPLNSRAGRSALVYFARQYLDESRSFALSAASLSFITWYYTHIQFFSWSAPGCWLLWAILQRQWLKENGVSPHGTRRR